jgi:tetrahydromethanopterin S-methyltransferase subunit H
MVGSIFYAGHSLVLDENKGEFNRLKAEQLLQQQEELSRLTGLPYMLDVVASTERAMINYLEFLAVKCDAPLLVDSMSPAVRLAAIRHFALSEVSPRLIYNSIDEHATKAELETIAATGIKSAVIMAFSNTAIKPAAKIKLLMEKLLPMAESAGVDDILVDPGVLDLASIGWTAMAMKEIKEVTGYPVGCAPANALYSWKKKKSLTQNIFEVAAAAVFSYLLGCEADFLLYGPLSIAPWAFPACATTEAVRTYAARLDGIRPLNANHPLNLFL